MSLYVEPVTVSDRFPADTCACGHHWDSHRDAIFMSTETGCVAAGCACRVFVWTGEEQ